MPNIIGNDQKWSVGSGCVKFPNGFSRSEYDFHLLNEQKQIEVINSLGDTTIMNLKDSFFLVEARFYKNDVKSYFLLDNYLEPKFHFRFVRFDEEGENDGKYRLYIFSKYGVIDNELCEYVNCMQNKYYAENILNKSEIWGIIKKVFEQDNNRNCKKDTLVPQIESNKFIWESSFYEYVGMRL
jgi:hypothetical protein